MYCSQKYILFSIQICIVKILLCSKRFVLFSEMCIVLRDLSCVKALFQEIYIVLTYYSHMLFVLCESIVFLCL